MSIKSKIAAIAAASIGVVLTQSSATRAETEDNSAPEKVTKIAAPIDVDEVFYSAVPDEVLERAAASQPQTMGAGCNNTVVATGVACCNTQVKKSSGGLKYEGGKPPLGPTVPPKSTQGIKNK